jgi:hypothetical protein
VRAEEERLLRQVASRRATAEALQQTTKREQVWSTLGIASTVQVRRVPHWHMTAVAALLKVSSSDTLYQK